MKMSPRLSLTLLSTGRVGLEKTCLALPVGDSYLGSDHPVPGFHGVAGATGHLAKMVRGEWVSLPPPWAARGPGPQQPQLASLQSS